MFYAKVKAANKEVPVVSTTTETEKTVNNPKTSDKLSLSLSVMMFINKKNYN